MRVFLCVRKRVVAPVHYCIRSRIKERGPLKNKSKKEKDFFPKIIHLEHIMRGISMQEERLKEQREIPMKEYKK